MFKFIDCQCNNYNNSNCILLDKCWTGRVIKFSDEKLGEANLDGYIDADLDLNRINNAALVNNITFNGMWYIRFLYTPKYIIYFLIAGQIGFKDEPIADISVKFPSIKLVRIQRIIVSYYKI